MISPTVAALASAAPIENAADGPTRSHTRPKSSDAGSAAIPIEKLNQPNAVPRRSAGTRSARVIQLIAVTATSFAFSILASEVASGPSLQG